MPISVSRQGPVATLKLELPRGNAISAAFLVALGEALDEIEGSNARAVVVTGAGKVLSTGLDLVEAFELDRAGVARFVRDFDAAFERLFAFPRPVVAAVNGHAIAGGCILAAAADWRVMAQGGFQIGVTEAQVGIPFPAAAMEVVRHGIPAAAWTDVFLEGRRFSPDEALELGLVQAVVVPEEVLPAAQAKAEALAAIPPHVSSRIKADLKRDTLARIAAKRDETHAAFVEGWFAPEAQATIGGIRERLLAKK